MFSPVELDLERGWPGRIEGDRVVQLAAQTLQAFFTGGGQAREHAEFPLDEVVLRAPVLHPPSVRIYTSERDFVFANATAIHGPEDVVRMPEGVDSIVPVTCVAAVVGADGAVGGYTLMNDWHAPDLPGVKAFDFAMSLGPIVQTPDRFTVHHVDFDALLGHAAQNTRLLPGDVIVAPGGHRQEAVRAGDTVEVSLPSLGVLRNVVG
jgi:2-keto-4-pentenoate hydratase/2-oxohepta-3-ene-1,7-dioic acid hydratase in catechol pathway